MKHKSNKVIASACVLLTLTVIPSTSHAGAALVGPVGGVSPPADACNSTSVTVTYTAMPITQSDLEQLEGANAYYNKAVTVNLFGIAIGQYYSYSPRDAIQLNGSLTDRLAQINKYVFGTEQPAIGTRSESSQAYINFQERPGCIPKHSHVCISNAGAPEGGGLQGYLGTATRAFPGSYECAQLPEGDNYCYFGVGGATIDMGTFLGGGAAAGKTTVPLTCRGDGAEYRVELQQGGGVITEQIGDFTVRVDGLVLPAVVKGTTGTRSMVVQAEAKTKPGSTGPFRVSGVLVLKAQ